MNPLARQALVTFFSILVVVQLYPGVSATGWLPQLLAAFVLTGINLLVRPLLLILTLPITILSLGLFFLVINAICLRLTDWLVPGFDVGSAFIGSLLISIVSMIINRLVLSDRR
jgi:putative membrane protein